MKFGQNLHQHQVVEWIPFYIEYNALKKLYKVKIKIAAERGGDADLEEYAAALKHELSKVELFYAQRHTIIKQRINVLNHHYGITATTRFEYVNGLELEDLTIAFNEIRDALKQLNWYGLVNVDKILPKLRKFHTPAQSYNSEAPEFYRDALQDCLRDICYVNDIIARLQSERLEAQPRSRIPLLHHSFLDGLRSTLVIDTVIHAIDVDDVLALNQVLGLIDESQESEELRQRQSLFALLHLATLNGSHRCVLLLLAHIKSLRDFGDHLHWLVIKLGRRKTFHNRQKLHKTSHDNVLGVSVARAIDQLIHVVRWLDSTARYLLYEKDSFGRLPLHHAVQYGLFDVCEEILSHMKVNTEADSGPSSTSSPVLLPDTEGLSALDISVYTGNAPITELLIKHRQGEDTDANASALTKGSLLLPGNLLTTALRLNYPTTIQLLHDFTSDINYKDYNNETTLYLAVRSSCLEHVKMLLGAPARDEKLDLNGPEVIYGWTPLILACVRGDLPAVEILLRAGADPTVQDLFGWTAKDHAAYRGYLPMARTLIASMDIKLKPGPQIKNHQGSQQHIRKAGPSRIDPDYFIHAIPPGYSQVCINLGPLDTYKPMTAVNLVPYVSPDVFSPQRESEFQLEIRAIGSDQPAYNIQLPILEDMANKPWRFLTKNARDFKLAFNVYPATADTRDRAALIGSAVALVDNLKQGLGSRRESLIRDFTIPILQKDNLDVLGTLTFYSLVITPFPDPCMTHEIRQDWELRKHDRLTIIGHRGVGQNDPSRRQLQIGENTMESFLSAMDLGASYIEFDVQLTKDDVPIIYHDFLMSETGIDAPLHSLSFEQFMYISEAQATLQDLPSMAETRYLERCGGQLGASNKRRSYSLSIYEQSRAKSLVERMKHTFEFKLNESKGFESYKGNIRSEYIQSSFMTLEELLVRLPESVKFDIEIKYPMLFEAHDWGMDSYAIELNHLVDNILEKVYRLAGNRTIFFSSFSPEICILLSNKQHVYPVYFLTESGHIISADSRADSLQEAIHFAKSWNLPGVICRSQPLVMSPGLIKHVNDSGLMCISWGELNDEPQHAQTQSNAGLDAIITNSVNLISQKLK